MSAPVLSRKIDQLLSRWKSDPQRLPLILKGCRQCGKTFSVLQFARANYDYVAYVNFFENPSYSSVFSGALDTDTLTLKLSAVLGSDIKFVPGKTVIVLDEIQACPEARTALKFFKTDGRYDVIATGSLLGVSGYRTTPTSVPVGYETIVEMYPLDFEEFLWANGISAPVIDLLRQSLVHETPVFEALHERLMTLVLQYTVVGGMPACVQRFLENRDIYAVHALQKDLLSAYKDDMVKYAEPRDKARIRECFESIPVQLAKDNKKFQYSVVRRGGRSSEYIGSLQWIEDAGLIARCRNLSITELPLDGNAIPNCFKVYMADTGLFTAMLEEGTQADILRGNLFAYKGAVFENLVADFFVKMGRPLFYFQKDSGLELDFVIRWRGACTPVEIKAVTGNAKSLKTVLAHPEKYHVASAVKLGQYNVGRTGSILTLPLYMGCLLSER